MKIIIDKTKHFLVECLGGNSEHLYCYKWESGSTLYTATCTCNLCDYYPLILHSNKYIHVIQMTFKLVAAHMAQLSVTHPPTCTCTHTCTHMHMHTPCTHMCTHMHMHTHMCTHIHTHAHTCTHMHTHAHTCARTHTHMHTHMHTHAHTHAHIHIHAHMHMHTCTHTHIHLVDGHTICQFGSSF